MMDQRMTGDEPDEVGLHADALQVHDQHRTLAPAAGALRRVYRAHDALHQAEAVEHEGAGADS